MVAAQTSADQERARKNRQRGAVVDYEKGKEAELVTLRAQLAASICDGELITDGIPHLLALQTEIEVLNLALATVARREVFEATQRALDSHVATLGAELDMESARLELHEVEVQTRPNELSQLSGTITTTSMGTIARDMRENLLTIDRQLTHARRLSREHAEKESK